MTSQDANQATQSTPSAGAAGGPAGKQPRLTVFALPKPFTSERVRCAQLNAIRSWRSLGPGIEVLLLGDEEGIADAARSEGCRHLAGISRNAQGTPLISSAFQLANQAARGEHLLYCNADVIFRGPLTGVAERLGAEWPDGFLGFGRRREVSLPNLLDWQQTESVEQTLNQLSRAGRIAARVCKEYFLFRRGQFQALPAFAVGRGNWDNWMVAQARRSGLPVVDTGAVFEALHQEHGYSHLGAAATRWNCYVSGGEARENERLAGGKWLIHGSGADWHITSNGALTRKPLSSWNLDFWTDLPRFLQFSCRLPFQR